MTVWMLFPAALVIILVAFSLGYGFCRWQAKTDRTTRREPQPQAPRKTPPAGPRGKGPPPPHRQTEQKLRGYIHLMDTLINTIPNPIYYLGSDGTFMGCNQAFARQVAGTTRGRIIGRRLPDLAGQVPPELVTALSDERLQPSAAAGETSGALEAGIPCPDGATREFLTTTTPVQETDGTVSGVIGVMIDLTEKNRAAVDRMRRERFEGVLETAGAVCHELNQPLQILSGYAELARTRAPDRELTAELSRQIVTQVDRMARITEKLRKITRYETMAYGEDARIIDINRASAAAAPTGEET